MSLVFLFFFFNDTATTEIYTLSLHDALPISESRGRPRAVRASARISGRSAGRSSSRRPTGSRRSEEHTSELQSRLHLVCRLLLEKKKGSRCHRSNALRAGDAVVDNAAERVGR